MLNIFPTLLSFSLLAPFLLRVFVGLSFARFGVLKLTKDRKEKVNFFEHLKMKPGIFFVWVFGIVEIVVGLMLMAGFLTQIVAIIGAVIMLSALIIKLFSEKSLPNEWDFYFLFFIICISLMFSGAGFFAIDLPL